MNTKTKLLVTLLSISLATLIASCDGGNGSSGQSGSAVTFGTITKLGSITVNGVKFETDASQVAIGDTQGADDSGLRVGMVAEVQGTVNPDGTTGTADVVIVATQVKGPISGPIETTDLIKKITVMGQTILLESGSTVFDDDDPAFTFDTVAEGEVVLVNGFIRNDGTVMATFIEKKADDLATFLADGNELKVTGKIANLDIGAQTFEVNALAINYTEAALKDLDDAPTGALANDLMVEVHGDGFDADTLIATEVEVIKDGLSQSDADETEIEGFVADLDPTAETFSINGQPVNFANARFKLGQATELADGIKAEVEGPMAAGVILADEVEIKSSIKIEGNAAIVDPDAGTLTVEGLDTITITTDTLLTEFDSATALVDIAVGNNLEILARMSGPDGTTLVATRISLEDVNGEPSLSIQGPVESFDALSGMVTILGVGIDTTGIPDNDFEVEDTSKGKTAFFEALTVGSLVSAEADLDPAITWKEIEIEIENDD